MPEYTPATIAQVDALISVIGDLQRELGAHRVVVEKAHKRSRAAIILSVLSIALIFLAGAGALSNRQAVREINQTRDEARRVTCVQENVGIARDRAAISGSIIALAPPDTVFTEEQMERIAAYTATVTALTPFRDCSEKGIEEYYNHLPVDPATTR